MVYSVKAQSTPGPNINAKITQFLLYINEIKSSNNEIAQGSHSSCRVYNELSHNLE